MIPAPMIDVVRLNTAPEIPEPWPDWEPPPTIRETVSSKGEGCEDCQEFEDLQGLP